jgi:transposase
MEKELQFSAIKLSPKEQETLRKRIVRELLKAGCNTTQQRTPSGAYETVAQVCECSYSHVKETWRKYRSGGVSAIKIPKMGRPINSGNLTEDQQKQIRKLIVDKNPDQLKLPGFLWNRKNIRALIKQQFQVEIALQNISVYLKKWGMSPQRPIKVAYKQKPEEVQQWLETDFPAIKARAEKENAEIHWGDETGCQNETNYVKGYAPIGQTPTMPVGNEHLRVNMISSITNQGKLRFMFYRGSMNGKVFLKFLVRLVKDAKKRKIFLIVDNLKTHHSNMVSDWLETHKNEIELFFLPPYSPQHNPDEYLNGNLKRELAKKGYSKTEDEIESKARSTMKKFQVHPNHVASFFHAKKVVYAA